MAIKKLISAGLRCLADKIDPRTVKVYPTEGTVQYYGETYKPVRLRANVNIKETTDAQKDWSNKMIARELATAALPAVKFFETEVGVHGIRIDAELLVLTPVN